MFHFVSRISCNRFFLRKYSDFNFAKKNSNKNSSNPWTKFVSVWNRPLTSTEKKQSTLLYVMSVVVATVGLSYAAVPLYRMFCASTGYGGSVKKGHDKVSERLQEINVRKNRIIRVDFQAETAAQMQWNFEPQQEFVNLHPGETALAFYRAKNPTSKPIIGISSYNVIPFAAGNYFNKIQCFCFEEQILNPNEEVDMPIFFYIDPAIDDDPILEKCENITLSYTFFEAKPGMTLPFSNVEKLEKQY